MGGTNGNLFRAGEELLVSYLDERKNLLVENMVYCSVTPNFLKAGFNLLDTYEHILPEPLPHRGARRSTADHLEGTLLQ